MKTIKEIRVRHENDAGNVTQELVLVVRRAKPSIDQYLMATENGIRAGTALFELSVNRHLPSAYLAETYVVDDDINIIHLRAIDKNEASHRWVLDE